MVLKQQIVNMEQLAFYEIYFKRICAKFKTFWFVCLFGGLKKEKGGKIITTLHSNLP